MKKITIGLEEHATFINLSDDKNTIDKRIEKIVKTSIKEKVKTKFLILHRK